MTPLWGTFSAGSARGFGRGFIPAGGGGASTNKLYAWGYNPYGNLGTGNTTTYSSPVQVGSTDNYVNVVGRLYSTYALKTNGTLWSWGYNTYGQLGQNNTTNYSSPVQVGTLTTWSKLATGTGSESYHYGAIKTDGTLWMWGGNAFGNLGTSNTTTYSSPVQVGADTNWSKVSIGYYHTVAIKTDGTLWVWGYNGYGQLGTGNVSYYSSPVQVGAGTNWSDVVAGTWHTVATKTDGTVWTWGRNQEGQLGYDTSYYYSCFICTNSSGYPNYTCYSGYWGNCLAIADKSSPVQVGSNTNWKNVFAGEYSTWATTTTNALWAWGYGGNGALGLNNTTNYSSPVQVGTLTNWSTGQGRSYGAAFIKTDGSLWVWGYNGYGQLGQNNLTTYSSPVQVGAGTNWISIGAEEYSTLGITSS